MFVVLLRLPLISQSKIIKRYLSRETDFIINPKQFCVTNDLLKDMNTAGYRPISTPVFRRPFLEKLLEKYKQENYDIGYLSKIIDKTQKETSKIESRYGNYWLNDFVKKKSLRNRSPLYLFQNQYVFLPKVYKNMDHIRIASFLIINSLRIYKTFQSLTSEISFNLLSLPGHNIYGLYQASKTYLDYKNCGSFFGWTRIPSASMDQLKYPSPSRHIIVLFRGNIYKLDVLTHHGDIIDQSIIMETLKKIMNQQSYSKLHVGLFTSLNREQWADIRAKLNSISSDSENLETIESALFAVCMDTEDVPLYSENYAEYIKGNINNRWFDKSLQIIVDKEGNAAICYETSLIDRNDAGVFANILNELSNEETSVNINPTMNHAPFSKLEWSLTNETIGRLVHCKKITAHSSLRCIMIELNYANCRDYFPDNTSVNSFMYYFIKNLKLVTKKSSVNLYRISPELLNGKTCSILYNTRSESLKTFSKIGDGATFVREQIISIPRLKRAQAVLTMESIGFHYLAYLEDYYQQYISNSVQTNKSVLDQYMANKDILITTIPSKSRCLPCQGYSFPNDNTVNISLKFRKTDMSILIAYLGTSARANEVVDQLINVFMKTYD